MKMLVISNVSPHSDHTEQAANVVVYELVCALANFYQKQVAYLRVQRHEDPDQLDTKRLSIKQLSAAGVTVLEDLVLEPIREPRPAWQKLISPRREDFYPESANKKQLFEVVSKFDPDVVLVPWSSWITALCADLPMMKFAYYGNPDHKVGTYRMMFDRRHGINSVSSFKSSIYMYLLEREHRRVMQQYQLVGNVAANDADYYTDKGHVNSFYIQNLWIDRFGSNWKKLRERYHSDSQIIKIIANVGQLSHTANRWGLEILGADLAPKLRMMLKDIPYELHVLGRGELIAPLKNLLDSPEIKVRGFVEDIDKEILESTAFLCLNNASPFKVCHTRYLHAWSLGSCVIAHQDAALSMPEMQHRENCLLGENIEQIAELTSMAVRQPDLRNKIGENGYETFNSKFRAASVAPQIWQKIQSVSELDN